MGLRSTNNYESKTTLTALLTVFAVACSGSVSPSEGDHVGTAEPSDTRDESDVESPSDDSPPSPDATDVDEPGAPSGTEETPSGGTVPVSPTPLPTAPIPDDAAPDDLVPPNRSIVDACGENTLRGAANSGLRKLTKTGLLNALRTAMSDHKWYELSILREFQDFTYVTFEKRDAMQIAFNQYPEDFSFKAGDDFQQTYSRDQLAAWLQLVDVVASGFASNGYASTYTSGGCFVEDASLDCRTQLVTNFGKKAFRRPLSDDEVAAFSSPGLEGGAGDVVAAIVSRMLQSPQFMYMLELGEDTASDGRIRVSDYDVANRLAFSLTDAPPDAELLGLAESGELGQLEVVRAQAKRLVATENGKKRLGVFFNDWLELDSVSNPPKSWGNFKKLPTSVEGLFNSDKLSDLYHDEAKRFLDHVVWSIEGTFSDLMTLPIAFPSDADHKLEAVYQTTSSVDGEPAPAPLHPGLLTRPALLASRGQSPSPIHRGLRVLSRVLCNPVPSPDFTVVASRVERLNSFDPHELPNFEITTQMTAEPACSSCHQVINPIGFIFEAYNPLGQRDSVQRVIENIYSFEDLGLPFPTTEDGVEYAELTQFELPGPQTVFIEEGLPSTFDTPDAFVQAIGDSQSARACLAVRYFRHVNHRNEATNDACGIAETASTLKNDSLVDAFVNAVANEDIFWRKP